MHPASAQQPPSLDAAKIYRVAGGRAAAEVCARPDIIRPQIFTRIIHAAPPHATTRRNAQVMTDWWNCESKLAVYLHIQKRNTLFTKMQTSKILKYVVESFLSLWFNFVRFIAKIMFNFDVYLIRQKAWCLANQCLVKKIWQKRGGFKTRKENFKSLK